ncbi:hypothetical protein EZV62_024970 [Acer yangbiense]|uniref:CCHC-type domain-containing protein n=1 Tax=Acer yangbiense TaxID=1000413 RepID=A0A5C7GX93_9ROSI|nr:hypothetical protein EZV62_024970 [Acer yangbiense]
MCMNMNMAKMITKMIGEVIEIPVEDRECWCKFLRVKVALDVMNPLTQGLILNMEGFGTSIRAPLRYERLPKFCYGCGRIGHSLRDCNEEATKTKVMEGGGAIFGSWLKAEKVFDKVDKVGRKQNLQKDLGQIVTSQKNSQLVVEMEGIINEVEKILVSEVEGNTKKDNEINFLIHMEFIGQIEGDCNTLGKSLIDIDRATVGLEIRVNQQMKERIIETGTMESLKLVPVATMSSSLISTSLRISQPNYSSYQNPLDLLVEELPSKLQEIVKLFQSVQEPKAKYQ